MELKSLQEVDLKEATFPLSRSAPSNFLPALRTPAYLRELLQAGVLDATLSKVAVAGGHVAGCCLVLRTPLGGFVSGLGVAPLAAQQGAMRILLDAVIAEATAANLGSLSIETNEADAGPQGVFQTVGFVPVATRLRMALLRSPDRSVLPSETADDDPAAVRAISVPVEEALTFQTAHECLAPPLGQHPDVLLKFKKRLVAAAIVQGAQPRAMVVVETDRKLVVSLCGELDPLRQIAVFAAARLKAAFADSLLPSDPACEALALAGFDKIAVRSELRLMLPSSPSKS